jgi:hypothetical protein
VNQSDVNLAQVVNHLVTTIALLIGGCWALWRFRRQREDEGALHIGLSTTAIQYSAQATLLSFDVELVNRGKIQISASQSRPAFVEKDDTVPFAATLAIRRIHGDAPVGTLIDWFAPRYLGEPTEYDLLDTYTTDDKPEFWMEPGETYYLRTTIVVPPGTHLAMVTFIGEVTGDFWRRVFVVSHGAVEAQSHAVADSGPQTVDARVA